MNWDQPKPQARSAPSPLVGEGGEGGGGVTNVGASISGPPPLTPPHKGEGNPSPLIEQVTHHLATRARWGAMEVVFWLAALASIFLLPSRHLILTEIAWLALFALSLDLILGYAGIISLGHAAFFGLGSYVAALLAKHAIINEPVLALLAAGLAAGVLGFATSFLVLRGSDLTRLMVTLGVALIMREIANQIPEITGGADGLQGVTVAPILGTFHFDIFGQVAYAYCLIVLFVFFLLARRIVYSPFGLSLRAVKGNPLRSSLIGISVDARLIAVYTLAAFYAGVAGALLAQTTAFASLDVFSFERSADLLLVLIIGGAGYLYGGLIGAVIFKLMQDWIANLTPQYWQFWIGLVLVVIVLIGRDRIGLWTGIVRALARRAISWSTPPAAPIPVPPGKGR
jgi:branched-chain amino acid transport system permease protein